MWILLLSWKGRLENEKTWKLRKSEKHKIMINFCKPTFLVKNMERKCCCCLECMCHNNCVVVLAFWKKCVVLSLHRIFILILIFFLDFKLFLNEVGNLCYEIWIKNTLTIDNLCDNKYNWNSSQWQKSQKSLIINFGDLQNLFMQKKYLLWK